MNEKSLQKYAAWSRDYRARMEPTIHQRFADRGQTMKAAADYIAGCCWEHPHVALARINRARHIRV